MIAMMKPSVNRGGVYRHGHKWYGKFKIRGKVHRTKLFASEFEAGRALRELRAKVRA
jgi:hypothetical protein